MNSESWLSRSAGEPAFFGPPEIRLSPKAILRGRGVLESPPEPTIGFEYCNNNYIYDSYNAIKDLNEIKLTAFEIVGYSGSRAREFKLTV
jgi:hypothetical protein